MKFTPIVVASMALFAVAHQAQAVTRLTGASATAVNIVEGLSTNNVCASNNVSILKRGTSTSALGNNFTIKCNSGNFAGTSESEIQLDVTGGSLNAILFSSAGTSETSAGNGNFLPATTANCTSVTGTGPLAFLTGGKLKNCAANATLTAGKSIGGFMDVEPALFAANGAIAGDYTASITPASFSQVFGVAVSNDLYLALQTAQGLAAGTAPANQPSISKAQLTSLISSIDFNTAKDQGPKFLVPGTAQTNLSYCRRPNSSGTQAAAESYFLGKPGLTGALAGALEVHEPVLDGAADVVVSNGKGNTVTFKMNSGSGNARTCLNNAGFAFGFLSAENNPIGTTDTYRFVKLSQAEFAEGASGTSQTATAIKGAYDFVYESVIFNPTASPVLDVINASIKSGPTTPGVFLNVNSLTPESLFGRGGNSVAPYASN